MNLAVAEIELYKILKTRFSEDEAESIVANFDQKVNNKFEERKNEFATKDDLYSLRTELKEDIKNLEIATKKGFYDLRTELKEDIKNVELRIAKTHADIIKWMFIFWIGQLASFIAIAKFLFHQ